MAINDFTSLNGIQLLCDDRSTSTALEGPMGEWDELWTRCPNGEHVTKLAVRGMEARGNEGDNYGATNVKVVCSGGTILVGKGGEEGVWTDFVECLEGMQICGIRAKIEDNKSVGDNTALNRIQLLCCHKDEKGDHS